MLIFLIFIQNIPNLKNKKFRNYVFPQTVAYIILRKLLFSNLCNILTTQKTKFFGIEYIRGGQNIDRGRPVNRKAK